jgi:putative endonuclease
LRFSGKMQMRDEYIYYVYMMHSASRRALYIGMSNNLRKRVWQHKTHAFEGFTDDYNCTRLIYWESFDDVRNASTEKNNSNAGVAKRKCG